MSNSQFVAIVGAVIIFLIGTLLFERYADCQAKGGSLILSFGGFSFLNRMVLECQVSPSPKANP
jgi:hypothetical protein